MRAVSPDGAGHSEGFLTDQRRPIKSPYPRWIKSPLSAYHSKLWPAILKYRLWQHRLYDLHEGFHLRPGALPPVRIDTTCGTASSTLSSTLSPSMGAACACSSTFR